MVMTHRFDKASLTLLGTVVAYLYPLPW